MSEPERQRIDVVKASDTSGNTDNVYVYVNVQLSFGIGSQVEVTPYVGDNTNQSISPATQQARAALERARRERDPAQADAREQAVRDAAHAIGAEENAATPKEIQALVTEIGTLVNAATAPLPTSADNDNIMTGNRNNVYIYVNVQIATQIGSQCYVGESVGDNNQSQ
jgi:hypothetical protein